MTAPPPGPRTHNLTRRRQIPAPCPARNQSNPSQEKAAGAVRAEDVTAANTPGKDSPEAQRFVMTLDGGLDWGEIPGDVAAKIRRQGGPIRLQVGHPQYTKIF